MSVSRSATALGAGAIVLWASLATLTVLRGPMPPFQTTAIAFAIGGSVIALAAILRGRAAAMRPTPASLALGVYGLFGYHALYFAALSLAPPAEAHLLNSLWALLIVLFSGLLPGHRLALRHIVGALLGLIAATLLVWSKLGAGDPGAGARLGFLLAFGCALVWSTYSVASRLVAAVPSESLAVSCFATAALACVCSLTFEMGTVPQSVTQWIALAALGLGPVGAAFLLWDIGMKRGDIATLGVLSYASPILSTLLLIALGLSDFTLALGVACLLMVVAGVIATRPG
jgi:drug/metabolite transporter (DMT)-like permease